MSYNEFMEYEQTPQPEPEVVHEIPIWAKLLFRFHAPIILGIVAIVLVRFLSLVPEVLNDVGLDQSLIFVAVLFLGLVIVSITIAALYGYSLFRLKRWTVIPSCFVAFNACLYLYIYTTLPSIHPVVVIIVVSFNILSLFVAATSVLFRNLLSKSSKITSIIFGTLFILLLLPCLIYGLASIIVQDHKTVKDSDLILEPVKLLSQADNAHYYLPDIDTLDDIKTEQYQSALDIARAVSNEGLNIDQAKIAVKETQTLTDAFITASKQKGYQCPTSVNKHDFDTVLCSLNDIRDLGMLTTLRAKVALSEGNVEDAAESSLAVVKMARHMEETHQTLIEYLVAVTLYDMAAEPLRELASLYNVQYSSTTQRATSSSGINDVPNIILLAIQDTSPGHTNLSTSYRGEYLALKNRFMDQSILKNEFNVELKESYLWHPNRTTNFIADLTRKQIMYANLECGEGKELAIEMSNEIEALRMIEPIDYVKPNILGRILLSVSAASLTDARNKACLVEQQYEELEAEFENIVLNKR